MTPTVLAAASLACLLLAASIFHCNIRSGARSWLRSDMLAMILLSLLVGLSPLPLAGAVMVPLTLLAVPSEIGAVDLMLLLVAWGAIAATAAIFRALIVATYRRETRATGLAPLPPRAPQSPQRPTGGRPAPARRAATIRSAA